MTVVKLHGEGWVQGRRLDEIEWPLEDAMRPCDTEPPSPVNALLARLSELYVECYNIARKKNADYASDEDPFSNFNGCTKYGISVPMGMLVRMEDKMRRIANLLDKPESVEGETLEDSCKDLANYALIMCSWFEMNPTNDEAPGYHGC